jgi:hypothetical protein
MPGLRNVIPKIKPLKAPPVPRSSAPKSPRKSSSGSKGSKGSSKPKSKKKIDVDSYGGGPGGFFREFLSNLFDVDLSLNKPDGPLGVVGGAMGQGAGQNVNMGRPAPQFNVTAQVAKRYNNPTLQVISNQISDIITSMSVINSQIKNQTEFQRFQYNQGLQSQREGVIESNTPTLLAANDNAPTSMLGTAGLAAAITRITDQITDIGDKLDEMEGAMGGGTGGAGGVDIDIDRKNRRSGLRGRMSVWSRFARSKYNKLPSWVRKGVGGIGKLGKGLGGLPGLIAAIVAEPVAEYLGKDTVAGATVSTIGTTATYAGMGRLAGMGVGAGIGAIFGGVGAVPGAAIGGAIGTGLGALYGLYEGVTDNWNGFTGGSPSGAGMTGSASEAMNYFQSRGWSKAQAAGIVGNLQGESGPNLNPGAVGDGGDAYGVAQWNQRASPDRVNNFQRVIGVPLRQSNFQQQLQFIDWELRNSEIRAGRALAAAQDPAAAALAMSAYERYQGWQQGTASAETQKRIANAQSLYGGAAAPGGAPPVAPMGPPPASESGRTNFTQARRNELLGQVNRIQSGRGPTTFSAVGANGTKFRARLVPSRADVGGQIVEGGRFALEMQQGGTGAWQYAADYATKQELMNAVEGSTLRNPAARRVQAPAAVQTRAAPQAAAAPAPATPKPTESNQGAAMNREAAELQNIENQQKVTVQVAQEGAQGQPMAGSTQPTGTMGNSPPDDPRSSVLDDIMPSLRYGGV